MKKSLIALACLAALSLAACRSGPVENSTPDMSYRISFGASGYVYVNVWTDPETGCEMLVTDDGFIQPRLNPDGNLRCPGAKATIPTGALPSAQ